ncbi:MAG: tetratricopeptide repeat protein [Nannocystaceae bacterium]
MANDASKRTAARNHPEVQTLLDLYASRRFGEAAATARRLISVYPRDWVFPNLLGAALSAQRRYDEARACYQRSIALNPRHPGTYNNLGFALRKLGRLKEMTSSCDCSWACA